MKRIICFSIALSMLLVHGSEEWEEWELELATRVSLTKHSVCYFIKTFDCNKTLQVQEVGFQSRFKQLGVSSLRSSWYPEWVYISPVECVTKPPIIDNSGGNCVAVISSDVQKRKDMVINKNWYTGKIAKEHTIFIGQLVIPTVNCRIFINMLVFVCVCVCLCHASVHIHLINDHTIDQRCVTCA